jgi:hypothetical protein
MSAELPVGFQQAFDMISLTSCDQVLLFLLPLSLLGSERWMEVAVG